MSDQNVGLTGGEWNVMECLWQCAPCTGRQCIDFLKENVGWSRSTTLTMLRRMTEKNLIECADINGVKTYSPLLKREETVIRETDDFLSRVYKGSVSMLVSTMTQKKELSKEEIDSLYAILKKAEEGNK